MTLFGTDPATIRTAVGAQLAFGALFFSLTARILPGYRQLFFWVLANVACLGAVFCEGLAQGDNGSVYKLFSGLLLTTAGGMVWLGVRAHLGQDLYLRRCIAVGIVATFGLGLPLWLFAPAGLAYVVLFNIIDAAILFDAARRYVRGQREFWSAQTGLLIGLIIAWAGFSLMTGIIEIINTALLPLPVLVELLNIINAVTTALIIISLNFFGFLLASQKMGAELRQLASTDSLTGIMNRRAFRRAADGLFRSDVAWGYLLMIDLDHFKQINDRYGHAVGDTVLTSFAETLRRAVRAGDFMGRTGGEEFCVLLPAIDGQAALAIAERIRAGTQALALTVEGDAAPLRVTVSIGVASIDPGCTLDQTMAQADKALYAAKRAGRNRVVQASPQVCETANQDWSDGAAGLPQAPAVS